MTSLADGSLWRTFPLDESAPRAGLRPYEHVRACRSYERAGRASMVRTLDDEAPGAPQEGFALCLSGGGYMAMVFHIGALLDPSQ